MRKFQVRVNGNTYEVEVEELQGGQSVTPAAPAPSVAPVAPKAAPAQPTAAPKPAPTSVPSGATTITAPMPGTILDIKVSQGQQVSEGDVVAVLEAMKMENEIVAPASGTISSINVSKGASVESGDVILSIG
ncbi:biotin/lipoyl-containing protein [Vallitalea okinawensis]|uniref:biotin/lipoyl-containing protein n=1 Tax=Vallitalea okinawensis TaxID=2078660 RepID=UPI000CFD7EBE|nr:biotin/lipoyl-containing protein [Vallitalea okinawensis]